jgi:cytoskeletal protein CcmA (bactofilin family)
MNQKEDIADLQISGYGSVPGGKFKSVKIFGRGKITGDLECDDFIINGSGDVIGSLACKQMIVNGSGDMTGEVVTDVLKVRGSANFNAKVKAKDTTISGSATVKDGLDAQTVKVSGSVKIKGDVSAENFSSTGRFEIDGLLNAETIDIHLDWSTSKAKEIGGESITVMNGTKGFSLISIVTFGTHNPRLEAQLIEGERIILENTTAKAVRGTHITIGDGCDIGIVEYKGSYHKSGSAKVGEEKKI